MIAALSRILKCEQHNIESKQ